METLNLIVNVASNKILNQDGITALRSISLIQGESYKVSLKFVGGDIPTIGAFAFYLRKENSNTNLVSISSVTAQEGDYPYYFTLPVTSPALTAALQGDSTPFKALLSWTEDGDIELIETFTAKVIRSTNGEGSEAEYVASVNGLSDAVTLAGAGTVSVSQSGQTITITESGGDVDLSEIEADIDALQSGVTAVEGSVATLGTDLDSAEVDITALQGDVSALETTLDAKADSSAVTSALALKADSSVLLA